MSVCVNIRMSKIMHTPIKVGICTYMAYMPIVEPCIYRKKKLAVSVWDLILIDGIHMYLIFRELI